MFQKPQISSETQQNNNDNSNFANEKETYSNGVSQHSLATADEVLELAGTIDKYQIPANKKKIVEKANGTSTNDEQNRILTNKPELFMLKKERGNTDTNNIMCQDGLILRAWRPLNDVTEIEQIIRGVIYFLAMCYLFIGIAIASNRFMEAIEVITSTQKHVSVINTAGTKEIITVRVWNESIANVTLMALGSSAPEIFLSIIEMFQKDFVAGHLGPGTIIGSAAYNLFVIPAVCIIVIPKGQVRKIQAFRVFIVTAFWSIFAYVWLCLITKFITPGIIDIWEGLLTFIFFPILVYQAYITERRLFCPSLYGSSQQQQQQQRNQRGNVVNAEEENIKPLRSSIKNLIDTPEMRDFEESRREYIIKLKELHRKYPHYELERIETMAQNYLIRQSRKSRAFYRIQSARRLNGGPNLLSRAQDYAYNEIVEAKASMNRLNEHNEENISFDDNETRIYFSPSHYTIIEGGGHVELHVIRVGNMTELTKVEYYTEDGTAEAGTDYVATQGILIFAPGIDEQIIKISIIDDDIIEEDEHFYCYLKNPSNGAVIVTPKVATIMIFDDDHCGIFGFAEKEHRIPETINVYEIKVKRYTGSRGKVILPYYIKERSAISGKDYEDISGELEFKNGEVEKTIAVKIIQEHSFEKDVVFEVHLGDPKIAEDDPLATKINAAQQKLPQNRTNGEVLLLFGLPTLAKLSMIKCHIVECQTFRQTVNKLVQTANSSKLIGTSSWKEQFVDALTVSGKYNDFNVDDDIDADDKSEDGLIVDDNEPNCLEYVSHFVSVFWKICFAIIPPAKLCNGYPCFIVSLIVLGILTAVLCDVAFHFGCTLGVLDSVTAICFVSLGTSLPDTFASGIAAAHDKSADNAIGNVTNSNAVNVFLGIGIAWSMAAIYHAAKGHQFYVPIGSLLFSTVLFIAEAFIAFIILFHRRSKTIGGELGGPVGWRWFHCIIFVLLWFIYLILSTMEAYGVIQGF